MHAGTEGQHLLSFKEITCGMIKEGAVVGWSPQLPIHYWLSTVAYLQQCCRFSAARQMVLVLYLKRESSVHLKLLQYHPLYEWQQVRDSNEGQWILA